MTVDLAGNYDESFFLAQIEGSIRSATVAVPEILKLFPDTKSVLDVGCGTGAWLSVFISHGITDVLGIDGSHANTSTLQIPRDRFHEVNLEDAFDVGRTFDLAVSVEVAEHLAPERARGFVSDLCGTAEIIIFSAAVPGQGGTQHIHEQWQTYWSRLFAAHGYECIDCLRPIMWTDSRVDWWYAQNLLCFVSRARLEARPDLRQLPVVPDAMRDIVHPLSFLAKVESDEQMREEVQQLRDVLLASPAHVRLSLPEADQTQLWTLQLEVDRLQREVKMTRSSASWKVTAPLRSIVRKLPALKYLAQRARLVARAILRRGR